MSKVHFVFSRTTRLTLATKVDLLYNNQAIK